MKKITLENGKTVEISDESYEALAKAVKVPTYGEIISSFAYGGHTIPVINSEHKRKLDAINKMIIVAKYLNGDWKPDWKNKLDKYRISMCDIGIDVDVVTHFANSVAYFKSEDIARRAIEILGEDTIKSALL